TPINNNLSFFLQKKKITRRERDEWQHILYSEVFNPIFQLVESDFAISRQTELIGIEWIKTDVKVSCWNCCRDIRSRPQQDRLYQQTVWLPNEGDECMYST